MQVRHRLPYLLLHLKNPQRAREAHAHTRGQHGYAPHSYLHVCEVESLVHLAVLVGTGRIWHLDDPHVINPEAQHNTLLT